MVWNHGAAANDVQEMPGVVSVPSPASRYLLALGHAVAALRPGAAVALVIAGGAFARFAREGLERGAAGSLDLDLVAWFSFSDPPGKIAGAPCDAVLACGPVKSARSSSFARWPPAALEALLGGVSPGLAAFPSLLDGDPEGLIAPVQWHPELRNAPGLGPTSAEVVADAEAAGPGELDYVAAQAYAAALIAEALPGAGPATIRSESRGALRTSTFFGAFELDPESGLQRAHRLAVIRWKRGRRRLLAGAE